MYPSLQINRPLYKKCSLEIKNIQIEPEGKEYFACNFELNSLKIIFRQAKITPKKTGQFVTFWKRNAKGVTAPFEEEDRIDYYVVNVQRENQLGQFVIPKSELMQKGIISTVNKEGKRGFRVYPPWDIAPNKQAEKTQQWQLKYFLFINESIDINRVKNLYGKQ